MRAFLYAAAVLAATVTPTGAETVYVENENFVDFYDIQYSLIQAQPAPACHGGGMLVGLDANGEWVEYDLTVSSFGTWSVDMIARGDLNIGYSFQLTATGKQSGQSQTIDVLYTGAGYG